MLNLGYEAVILDMSAFGIGDKPLEFAKVPAILHVSRMFPHSEWIWWLDIDAIIMNEKIDLYELVLDPKVLETKLIKGGPITLNEYVPIENRGRLVMRSVVTLRKFLIIGC